MLAIAGGHGVTRVGRTGPDGRPTMTVTDHTDADAVADPATALAALLADAAGADVVLGLPASAGREEEDRLRDAVEDAGLHVRAILPAPIAVALHYGAIDEGVNRTLLVVDQAAATVELTVLDIAPDLTAGIVTTRTEPVGDGALAATARELAASSPDAVLLSGELYTVPARRAEIEELPEARGLTVRCADPELAVVRGLLLREDFGLLRVITGPAPARSRFPGPPADPDPQPWQPLPQDPDPRGEPDGKDPWGTGSAASGTPGERDEPARADRTVPDAHDEPGPASASARAPERAPTEVPEPDLGPEPDLDPGPDPGPAEPPSSGLASAPALRAVPVTQLQYLRRDDHLLVLWAWPDTALTARVRWRREDATATGDGPREGDISCRRRTYEHDGGLDLALGRGAITLTVEALVADPAVDTEGAASLRIPAEPPVVEYEPALRRRLTGARVATVTLTARTGCDLPALRIVHGLGRYRPTSTAEGTVVHEIPAQRLPAGTPLTVEFPFPGAKGPSWLVCFPAGGPDTDHDRDIDLRPTALHRLRVT
ncbi:hypothetical protein SAMN04490357_1400 [Streptomyces misionensis]|uniref:Hsp70 family protein n=1 Tax=Streptomyces misionensis TaxID=67331 RepID=A0A1H4QGX2_9ACTN|nr:hypothetical protein [Streptomyces misionensis]SEC18778.1 hypothetical protein SAMN04490357_1400 [Streptomyces misionensis]